MEENIINILNNYDVVLETTRQEKSIINIPVYIINLNTNYYRRSYIKYITSKLNINYTLVIVKKCSDEIKNSIDRNSKNGIIGCFLSHLWCIKNAIENGYEHFIIFEDDVVFHKNFKNLFCKVDYKKYDLIQLGCCDFNLKKNMKDDPKKNLVIYKPCHLALGAYGNIYNINFAKLIFYEKTNCFKEFDTTFDMYYNKYDIGTCYPNLVTSELSTSDLGHDYSLFKTEHSSFSYNKYFTGKCFYDFDYNDYYFIWIIFIQYCHERYIENKLSLDNKLYCLLIKDFSCKYVLKKDIIQYVLLHNNLKFNDMNCIIQNICDDKFK
jgi:GR25 family glycosyltransferase involved in LPS biosynthesis